MKRIVTVIAVIALLTLTCALLTACLPKGLDEAIAKLEKKGYTVQTDYDEAALDWLGEKYGMTAMADARKGEEWVQICLFESKEKAEEYYEKNEAGWKRKKAAAKEEGSTFAYGQSGKWVYCGTKKAVGAFK